MSDIFREFAERVYRGVEGSQGAHVIEADLLGFYSREDDQADTMYLVVPRKWFRECSDVFFAEDEERGDA